jgi:hypothetical protein
MRRAARRIAITLLLGLTPAAWPAASDPQVPYHIINLVPDFLAYHEQAKDRNEAGRTYRWNTLLEAKYPVFFSDALYRGKEGADRERFKAECIRQFWAEVAPKIETVRALNGVIEARVRDVVGKFRQVFPDFRGDTSERVRVKVKGGEEESGRVDGFLSSPFTLPFTFPEVYVTISFSFRGKALTVGGKQVLAIGLEKFDADDPQIPITIAHELFHLYHFQTFSTSGALYRSLWAEGMAVAGSEAVVPGHRRSVYLRFPAEKMNRCEELLPTLARDLKKQLTSSDYATKRLYLSDDTNDAGLPTETGYYVGYLIVTELAKQQPLARLARIEPTAVLPLLERELTRLAGRE